MPAPDELTLRRFLLGGLSAGESATVEAFIDTDPDSASILERLKVEDSFTAALLGRTQTSGVDSEVESLASRLVNMPLATDRTRTLGASDAESSVDPAITRTSEDMHDLLSPPQSPDELGRLGDYRILRVLGEGGMGMVFEAEDQRLGRRVAVKVMRPSVALSPTAKARFIREAKAAAAVEHDHVVHIHLIAEERGVPFLVMPYLKGESLDDRLKREGAIPVPEIIRIAREIAEGLAAAHDRGLIHRDIKPGNIWLETPSGRVKILDFGLARGVNTEGPSSDITQSGAVVGTPAYMSPEQGRGQVVDARSDLFSLGGVMYRMGTGRTAFQGTDSMSVLMSLAADTPVDPRNLNPHVPASLASLIMRLLEKAPGKRPQSAREVAASLAPLPLVEALPTGSSDIREEFAFDEGPTEIVPQALPVEEPGRKRWRRQHWIVAATCLLAFGVALYFAPTLIRIATNKGELVIEVDDPNVEVLVKPDAAYVVMDKGKTKERTIVLKAGGYEVEFFDPETGAHAFTKKFTIDRGGRAVLTATRSEVVAARKPKPSFGGPKTESSAKVNAPTPQYREMHGKSLQNLLEWERSLPAGYQPTWVSARSGAGTPTFDAIALYDPMGSRRHFKNLEDISDVATADREWKLNTAGGYYHLLAAPYKSGDHVGELSIYMADRHDDNWWSWHGSPDFVREKLPEARENRWQIGALAVVKYGEGLRYSTQFAAPAGARWEYHDELSTEALAKLFSDYFDKGWRPRIVSIHQDCLPVRYAAVFEENPAHQACGMEIGLSAQEYESELTLLKQKGIRPHCVCSYQVDGQVGYTVVWTGPESSKPELSSSSAYSGSKPPPKDLFPGELITYEAFDEPGKCPWPQLKTAIKQTRCDNGVYILDIPDAKPDQAESYTASGPAKDVAIATRVRAINCAIEISFRRRTSGKRDSYLLFHISPDGSWSLRRLTWDYVNDDWQLAEQKSLANDDAKDLDLAAGKWINIRVHSTGPITEIWAGQKMNVRVFEPPSADEQLPLHSIGAEIGLVVADKGPARFEVDYVAAWKLPLAASPAPWAGAKPPPKDLFPGELSEYETFDDPKACKLFQGTQERVRFEVKDGRYEVSAGPDARRAPLRIGPLLSDYAFVFRFRSPNDMVIETRIRESKTRQSWLKMFVNAGGSWQIYYSEQRVVGESWVHWPDKFIAESDNKQPKKASDNWVTVAGRIVGDNYEFWGNGRLVFQGSVSDEAPPLGEVLQPSVGAISMEPRSPQGKAFQYQLAYAGVWKLSATTPGRWTGEAPPPKDLFPGEPVVYETCDDPTKCKLSVDAAEKVTSGVQDGIYVVSAPADTGRVPTRIGLPLADNAFALCLRNSENTIVDLRLLWSKSQQSWLKLILKTDGSWRLFHARRRLVDEKWVELEDIVLNESAEQQPELAVSKWLTLVGRVNGEYYEIWANGKLLSRGTIADAPPPGETYKPNLCAVSIESWRTAGKPSRYELKYAAVWKPAAAKPVSQFTAEQRNSLEWVLSFGGKLTILEGTKERVIAKGGKLPEGPFAVESISFRGLKAFNGVAVENLRDVPPIPKSLILDGTGITNGGLAKLAGIPGLNTIRELGFADLPLTDEALNHVKQFPLLRSLHCDATEISDAGLAHLKDMSLATLDLSYCSNIDGSGLIHLKQMTSLTHLNLASSKKLEGKNLAAIRDLKIASFWVGGCPGVSDDNLQYLENMTSLGWLGLTETAVTDKGLARLEKLTGMVNLQLDHNAGITDAGLAHFGKMESLNRLALEGTKVTAAGAKKLAAILPKCRIEFDGGVLGPK
jgi:serine/threonine protein kinase